MTVFSCVTATISPELNSYIRGKGKLWRSAFMVSLGAAAGVEYTVYKKKGCWQIKGDLDRIKHAYKILYKMTTGDDWARHIERQAKAKSTVPTSSLVTRPAASAGSEEGESALVGSSPLTSRMGFTSENTTEQHGDVLVKSTLLPANNDNDIEIKTEPLEQETVTPTDTMSDSKTSTDYTVHADRDSETSVKLDISSTCPLAEDLIPLSSDEGKIAKVSSTDSETEVEQESPSSVHTHTTSESWKDPNISSISPLKRKVGVNKRKTVCPRRVARVHNTSTERVGFKTKIEDNKSSSPTRDLNEDTADAFSDLDLDSNPSDSDDPDFSIDKMVADGKADLKAKSKGKIYSCNLCTFTCRNRNGVSEHKKRQHSEKTLKCPKCDKAYAIKRDLRKHIRRHTSRFSCEQCGKVYKEERNYKNHLKTHQEDYVAPVFACDQCPKSFTTKYVLLSHVDQVHRGNMPEWLCNICGKKFKQKHSLTEHSLIHTGERPFSCRICNKSFRNKSTCLSHELLHSDCRLFTCEVCGKDFKHRNSLRIHSAIHKTMKDYECSVCNKTFTQKQALVRHSRIHSGEKPFMCDLCGDRFNDTSILRRHMMGIHKTQFKSGKQHFVLPAEHYQSNQGQGQSESTVKNTASEQPINTPITTFFFL